MPSNEKFLTKTGLEYFFNRLKTLFASSSRVTTLEGTVQGLVNTGGEPNVIETIKVNNTALTPSGKAVNISVPTATGQLTNSGDGTTGSLYATQSWVNANGGKIDKIKVNNVEQTISSKTVNITVPTKVSDLTNDSSFQTQTEVSTAITNALPTKTSDLTNDGDGTSEFATKNFVSSNYGQIHNVKVNGTTLTVTNKAVDVTVPTKVSDLTNDSGFQNSTQVASAIDAALPTKTSDLTNDGDGTSNFATESYVATNGGKIDKIKVNNVEQSISSKTVNISVPTNTGDLTNNGDGTTGSLYATQAWVNTNGGKIDVIKVNNTTQTITSKTVNITVPTKVSDLTNDSAFQTQSEVATAISNAVASAYKYKGSKATVAALPSTGNTVGDVWNVEANGMNYAWTGSAWDALGQLVDTSVLWNTTNLVAITTAEIDTITADE